MFEKHLIEIRVKAQSRHQVLTVRSRSLPGLITIKKFCDGDGGSGDDDGNGGSDGGDGGDGSGRVAKLAALSRNPADP